MASRTHSVRPARLHGEQDAQRPTSPYNRYYRGENVKHLRSRLKLVILPLLLLLAACGRANTPEAPPRELPDRLEMFFIYEESCASCDGTEDFFALLHSLDFAYPYSVYTVNIYDQGGMRRFEELAQELLGVYASSLRLPVMILHGRAYQGMNDIANNLHEAVLTAGHDLFVRGYVFNPRYKRTGPQLFADYSANPNNITLVYFYRIVCPACEEIEHLFEALPATIGGRQVDVIRFNTRSGNNRERFIAFLDLYGVPNQYRRVPIIFTADGFYSGPESIYKLLSGGLETISQSQMRFP